MIYHVEKLKRDLTFVLSVLLVYGGAIVLRHPLGCSIERFTGIPCPTCGMSTAIYHACHLHFEEAFYFHPLFFVIPFVVVYYGYENYFREKRTKHFKYVMAFVVVLFIVVYIVRLLWFREALWNVA